MMKEAKRPNKPVWISCAVIVLLNLEESVEVVIAGYQKKNCEEMGS